MIDGLVTTQKISPEEYDLYMLYEVNELGRKVRDKAMTEMFMDEPSDKEFGGIGFAFYDGRRSYFRDVMRVIYKVQHILKELNNVEQQQPEPERPKRGRKPT